MPESIPVDSTVVSLGEKQREKENHSPANDMDKRYERTAVDRVDCFHKFLSRIGYTKINVFH